MSTTVPRPESPDELSLGNSALADYWYALIDEVPAAKHVDLKPRTLQNFRQKGGGPPYIRVSARCVKYRRVDLQAWAEERLRLSTSDPGLEDVASSLAVSSVGRVR